jgi:hypothetical protein
VPAKSYKVVNGWVAFGDYDVVAIPETPNNVAFEAARNAATSCYRSLTAGAPSRGCARHARSCFRGRIFVLGSG